MRKTLVVCCLLLFCAAAAPAGTVRFRSGEILYAELSRVKPADIRNRDKLDLSELPEQKIYAALTVSLDSGRKISIYDYSLRAFGVAARCIALRNGDNSIDGSRFEIDGNRCTLYFVLNAREVGTGGSDRLRLVCNAIPDSSEIPVVFVNRGSDSFTAGRDIPDSGKMIVGK